MNIGARIIKTGIAVALAVYISQLLKLQAPVFAAIAAFVAVQPSVYRSWKHFLEQVRGNLIGVLLAIGGILVLGNSPIAIGLVVVIAILINLKLDLQSSMNLSVITVIAIMEVQQAEFYFYAGNRFLAITIGILSSLILNILFLPPKYEDKLLHHIEQTSEQVSALLRSIIGGGIEKKAYEESITAIKDNLQKAETMLELYKDELNKFLKETKYSEAKKVIVFKQMVEAINKEKELVLAIHKYQNDITKLDANMTNKIDRFLHSLALYDEKIFMLYDNKMKAQGLVENHAEIKEEIISLSKQILTKCQENHDNEFLVHIYSPMLELSHELIKLHQIIEKHFHSNK